MFTFIMDLDGGIYVGQAPGSMQDGLRDWLTNIELPGFSEKDMTTLIESLFDEEPIPIDGLENVWCSSRLVGEKLALIHMIRTSTELSNPQSKDVP